MKTKNPSNLLFIFSIPSILFIALFFQEMLVIRFLFIVARRSQQQIETTTVHLILTVPSITREVGGIVAVMTPTSTVSTANSPCRTVCAGFIGGVADATLNELR